MKTVTFDPALWQVVPKVPTFTMVNSTITYQRDDEEMSEVERDYAAMLAAAPSVPEQSGPTHAMQHLSDDELWFLAITVSTMAGGSLFNVSQNECVTALRASFLDPDEARALAASDCRKYCQLEAEQEAPAVFDIARAGYIFDIDHSGWEIGEIEEDGKKHAKWVLTLYANYGLGEWEDDARAMLDEKIADLSSEDQAILSSGRQTALQPSAAPVAAVDDYSATHYLNVSLHYPECWDTAVYSTVWEALAEVFTWFQCNDERHARKAAPVEAAKPTSTLGQQVVKARADLATWKDVEPATPTVSESVHRDDIAVDRFAVAMKAKMAASRAKGRSGWNDELQCTMGTLARMLVEHVSKGDPVDIANFAMMLHQREAAAVEHHPCYGGSAARAIRGAAIKQAAQGQDGAVAMLDFIDSRKLHVQACYDEHGGNEPTYEVSLVHGDIDDDSLQCFGSGQTLRAAIKAAMQHVDTIDAAIAAQQGKP